MSTNCILSAEVTFDKGEKAVRDFAAALGPVTEYMPPHFTLYYGGHAFSPEWKPFLEQFLDKKNPVFATKPEFAGFRIFYNPKKNLNCVAVAYKWSPGNQVNATVAWTPGLGVGGPTSGFNCDKFSAHVTIAYISGDAPLDVEDVQKAMSDKTLFDVTVKKIVLETSVKPE